MAAHGDGNWVDSLVRVLARVHEIEGAYLEEIEERRQQRELTNMDLPQAYRMFEPGRDLAAFYHQARYTKGRYFEERYAPMRTALHDAEQAVGRHPAVADIVNADEQGHEFLVVICNRAQGASRLDLVAGLMFRARQVGREGFRVASRELKALLDASLEEEAGPNVNNLTKGCHVSLFFGLRIDEEVEIADGVSAVPLDRTEAFLERNVLHHVVPTIAANNDWKPVGALLKPFTWKPMLLASGDERARELDWGGSFTEDARAFIEILSVSHGVPVVSFMGIPYCTDRTASLLLGQPHFHSSYGWTPWAHALEGLREAHELDVLALDQARQVYWKQDRQRHQEYAPVISRLAEALARTGKYAKDDRILDVAIALEQMYELDQGEISFKLKTRAACFLESERQDRMKVFEDVKDLYNARSGIVHKRKANPGKGRSAKSKDEAFKKGFDVARTSVFKLLREGPPQDWNEVVLR